MKPTLSACLPQGVDDLLHGGPHAHEPLPVSTEYGRPCPRGEHDRLCPPEGVPAVAASVPAALLAVLRGGGHFVHLERLPDFSDVLGRFMTDEPREKHPALSRLEAVTPARTAAAGCERFLWPQRNASCGPKGLFRI
jgi:hypothetical protein